MLRAGVGRGNQARGLCAGAIDMAKRIAIAAMLFSAGLFSVNLFSASVLSESGLPAQAAGNAAGQNPASPDKADAGAAGPAFEVATIKPVDADAQKGRYIVMQGENRFVAKNFTVKLLIAAAYNLNSKEISGGPDWTDSDHYDIQALTPGAARPNRDEQMAMLRTLLAERFKLSFHREKKDFSIYVLEAAKGGPKMGSGDGPGLRPSTAAPTDPPAVISTVYPDKMQLPARNATMADFVAMLQRALLDRPVVDKTGLTGRYDFDLEWAPDETQFGGEVPVAPTDAQAPPFFTALEQQLGLRLEATHGPAEALVVDHVERPGAN
jgi:uncharacterized protein (TIGR03435 family)